LLTGGRVANVVVSSVNLFRPGQVVRLLVERNGAKLTVRMKLGSLRDSIPSVLQSKLGSSTSSAARPRELSGRITLHGR
jgi:hypothetical protein